jgi:hypothetical protein
MESECTCFGYPSCICEPTTEESKDAEEKTALEIGFALNDNDLNSYDVPQCVVDEIFGKGYLLAKKQYASQKPQIERNDAGEANPYDLSDRKNIKK